MKKLFLTIFISLNSILLFAQKTISRDSILSQMIEHLVAYDYIGAEKILQTNYAVFKTDIVGIYMYHSWLGDIYYKQGEYPKALKHLFDAITIAKEHNSHDSALVDDYVLIGQCYQAMNDYKNALLYYVRAYDNYPVQNRNDESYSTLCNQIAELNLNDLDMPNLALPFLNEAKLKYEQNGRLNYDYVKCLYNISHYFCYMEGWAEAQLYADAAWQTCRSYVNYAPKEEFEQGIKLWSLIEFQRCVIYSMMGHYEYAENIYASMLKYIGKNSYWTQMAPMAQVMILVGKIYKQLAHNTPISEEQYKACISNIDVFKKVMSAEDFAYFKMIIADATVHKEDAITYAVETSKEMMKTCIKKSAFLTTEEMKSFWLNKNNTQAFCNLTIIKLQDSTSYDAIYNNAIYWKGLQLRKALTFRDGILQKGTSQEKQQLHQLETYERLLSSPTQSSPQYKKQVQDSIDYLERNLMHQYAKYVSVDKEVAKYDWKKIQKLLREDEIAIEFVNIPTWPGYGVLNWETAEYYAAIIRKGYKHPHVIELCNQKQIEELTQNTFSGASATQKFVTKLYSNGSPRFTNGDKLYELLWKPIEQELKGIKNVYFSPVGFLNSIAFNAISTNKTPISETYNLYQVSSTLEIECIKKGEAKFNLQSATVYGGIEYEANQTDLVAASERYGMPQERLYASRGIESSTERSGWYFLPGTKEESTWISNMLDSVNITTTCMQGYLANEESFKSLSDKSTDLIHIATHGFFLADEKKAAFNPFIQSQQQGQTNTEDTPSPMLRSGLLFAGANRAWTGTDMIEGIDDGILTAEEISNLNLSGTKIVVLSACETGLGEMQTSEGVYGLQRAFKLAGVETLVMSLWKVDDAATKLLMQTFYSHWMNGKTKHDAFKTAIQTVKSQPQYASPYYWAGFIMVD